MSDFVVDSIKLKNATTLLPNVILKNIYFKYNELYYSKKYDSLLITLNDDVSNRLDTKNIMPHINEILNDKNYISYLQSNNSIFKNIYQKHYVENNKIFVLMNVKDSLALSWLMYLHH